MPSPPRRLPPLAAGATLLLGALLAPSLLSLDGTPPSLASRHGPRRLTAESLYSPRNAEGHPYLQSPGDVDQSIEERARANDDPDRCARVLLYLPGAFAGHGHGSQINAYLMAAAASAYTDRALVLAESPPRRSRYPGGSQFGCPVDAFRKTVTRTTASRKESGFGRLIEHPAWLSRGCGVPCAGTHAYRDWANLSQGAATEVTCANKDGTTSNVLALAGVNVRRPYEEVAMALDRPSPNAERWALNLGATPEEAETFSNIQETSQVWDYVLGLMNRAGILKLRPWIARDVELFLESFDLPLDREYDAIHVRRGDKLAVEARGEVVGYWRTRGHTDTSNLPTDYVPFAHYLGRWDGPEACLRDGEGALRVTKHNVYVATDDPVVVRDEIAALPNRVDDDTVIWNGCHELKFYFNPTDDDVFHLNGDDQQGFDEAHEEDGCFGRYRRTIASMADMMILSKARTFIGEYNSNWGRVIRTLRVRLNAPVVQNDGGVDGVIKRRMAQEVAPLTRTLDTRVAWGPTRERGLDWLAWREQKNERLT